MKYNLGIGAAAMAAMSLIAFYALHRKPGDEIFSGERVRAVMSDVFGFEMTNAWRDVNVAGGVTFSSVGRRRVEYFLLQTGDPGMLDEIQGKFGRLEKRHDAGSFSYLTNYDPSPWKIRGDALKLAPWWNDEMGRSCTFVQLGTNTPDGAWSARLFVYSRGSNSVLHAHIVENSE